MEPFIDDTRNIAFTKLSPIEIPRLLEESSNRTLDSSDISYPMKTRSSVVKSVTDVDTFVQFHLPDEGTPAFLALKANAEIKVSKVTKGLRKINGLKRPQIKNISRRFKSKEKKATRRFARNFKGKVIDGLHELYTLTAGMMLGMRCAVGHTQLASRQHLTLEDFSYVEKITFPPEGQSKPPHITPPHSLAHTFKMKSYAPKVFRRIRDFFGLDPAGYMLSICGNYNYLEFISNAKSGQFFFYSHDGRYMIKTLSTAENKFLLRLLPHYYKFVTQNPHTQLVRYYGMHRVKMYHLRRNVHFVIMGSVFNTREPINVIYDLKGSLVGRKASPAEREKGDVLKDQDLLGDRRKLHLGSKREAYLQQLKRDTDFLALHNIMDYSLLVGIHDRSARSPDEELSPIDSPSTPVSPLPPLMRTASEAFIHGSHSNTPFRRVQSVRLPSRWQDRDASTNQSCDAGLEPQADRPSLFVNRSLSSSICEGKSAKTAQDFPDSGNIFSPNRDRGERHHVYFAGGELPVRSVILAESSEDERVVELEEVQVAVDGCTTHVICQSPEVCLDSIFAKEWADGIAEEEGDSDIEEEDVEGSGGELEEEHWDEGDSDEDLESCEPYVEGGFQEGRDLAGGDSLLSPGLSVEGARVTRLFRDVGALGSMTRDSGLLDLDATYGEGSTLLHPWTRRRDGGINGRDSLSDRRTSEIYFMGIIDVLQQFNAVKRAENFFKGLTENRSQISAVDASTYASRFMDFMTANID